MLLSCGDYQYSYRLWFEDPDTSLVVPVERVQGKSLPEVISEATRKGIRPLTSSWYEEITKKLFPNNKRIKCFELFALYLGGLNALTIASHNNSLVNVLRSR
jgi:hypothetical protein